MQFKHFSQFIGTKCEELSAQNKKQSKRDENEKLHHFPISAAHNEEVSEAI